MFFFIKSISKIKTKNLKILGIAVTNPILLKLISVAMINIIKTSPGIFEKKGGRADGVLPRLPWGTRQARRSDRSEPGERGGAGACQCRRDLVADMARLAHADDHDSRGAGDAELTGTDERIVDPVD